MSAQPSRRRRGLRAFGALHTFLYKRGIGRRFQGVRIILLTTTGRKSGKAITTPLNAQPDGDAFIVIASMGGADEHPRWWLNLLANPSALVRDGDKEIRVRAGEVTDPSEKARLWKKMTDAYPGYDAYTRKTKRVIPLALLRPVQQDARSA